MWKQNEKGYFEFFAKSKRQRKQQAHTRGKTWTGAFFILFIGLGHCLLRKPLQPVWKWPFGKPQSHHCCYAYQAFTLIMLNMELSDIQASILNVYNVHVKATFKYNACQMSIVNEENFKIEGKTHRPQCERHALHFLTIPVTNKHIVEQKCSCTAG